MTNATPSGAAFRGLSSSDARAAAGFTHAFADPAKNLTAVLLQYGV